MSGSGYDVYQLAEMAQVEPGGWGGYGHGPAYDYLDAVDDAYCAAEEHTPLLTIARASAAAITDQDLLWETYVALRGYCERVAVVTGDPDDIARDALEQIASRLIDALAEDP